MFFDPKEQVIEIQLTSYGKEMLAKGKFKPTLYAFFDDDVIYDYKYAHVQTEEQNTTQTRIKEETPNLRIRPNDFGIDTYFRRMTEMKDWTPKVLSLGNSGMKNSYAPAWNIKVHDNKVHIGSVTDHITSSLNLSDIDYNIFIRKADLTSQDANHENISFDLDYDFETDMPPFEDGTYIDIVKQKLFLEMKEENTEMSNDNFDVEVFVDYGDDEYRPLSFIPQTQYVDDEGRLLDEPILPDMNKLSPNNVEYFFSVLTDENIPADLLCSICQDAEDNMWLNQVASGCKREGSRMPPPGVYRDDVDQSTVEICDEQESE